MLVSLKALFNTLSQSWLPKVRARPLLLVHSEDKKLFVALGMRLVRRNARVWRPSVRAKPHGCSMVAQCCFGGPTVAR